MKNLNNKKILNITTIIILIGVPFLKFFSMNLQMFNVMNKYDNINPAIILYVSVPILLFIYIKDMVVKKRKLDIYDYIFFALLLSSIISCIFSINKNLAIFGKEYRHEGFLSVLSYYLIFINYKVNGTKEDIKKYISLIIIIAIINAIYALLQIYTDFKFILRYTDDASMASGMCGNPNFFGSLIVTAISFVIFEILSNKNMDIKTIPIIVLLYVALINCQSTGPFLTLILIILFLVVLLNKKRTLVKENFWILIIILITTYSYMYLVNYLKVKTLNNGSEMRCEMCLKDLKKTLDTGGNGRLEIWQNTLPIIGNNFITGVGFDNFSLAYPSPKVDSGIRLTLTDILINRKKEVTYYSIVDNAHNVYLHTLASTGILGLIPYLLLCLLTFIKGLKSKDRLVLALLSGFVAYSIQAFANISVVQVAPIYYLLIGLILSQKQ